MGIVGERTWPSSTTSPVRTSLAALSTESGFMWLAAPRSSPAPHFEGQRWLSEGGRQDGPWAAAVERPSAAITARPMTIRRIEPSFEVGRQAILMMPGSSFVNRSRSEEHTSELQSPYDLV